MSFICLLSAYLTLIHHLSLFPEYIDNRKNQRRAVKRKRNERNFHIAPGKHKRVLSLLWLGCTTYFISSLFQGMSKQRFPSFNSFNPTRENSPSFAPVILINNERGTVYTAVKFYFSFIYFLKIMLWNTTTLKLWKLKICLSRPVLLKTFFNLQFISFYILSEHIYTYIITIPSVLASFWF